MYVVGLDGGVEFGNLLRMMRDTEQGKKKRKKNMNVDSTEVISKLRKDNVRGVIVTKDTVEDMAMAEPHLTIERQRRRRVFNWFRIVEDNKVEQCS